MTVLPSAPKVSLRLLAIALLMGLVLPALGLVGTSVSAKPGKPKPGAAANATKATKVAKAERYQRGIKTGCTIRVTATNNTVLIGRPFTFTLAVRANAKNPNNADTARAAAAGPKGKNEIHVLDPDGTEIYRTHGNYGGKATKIQIPALHKLGRYRVINDFNSAQDAQYRDCQCELSFRAVRTAPPKQPNALNPNTSVPTINGVLPNTGGPSRWWLVLAGLLIGVGTWLIAQGRAENRPRKRRTHSPPILV